MNPPTHVLFTLTRDEFQPVRTIGALAIDGAPFGWVVEDVDRGLDSMMPLNDIAARKVKGRTAIPTGDYAIGVRYSPKHQREVLYLIDVPGFQYIEVHSGNDETDTDGCLIIGTQRTPTGVAHSRPAIDWLEKTYLAGIKDGSIVARIRVSRMPGAVLAKAA